MTKPPVDHENATHRCPECGGDATIHRDAKLRRGRRAWWLVLIIWGLGLIALLTIASPWGQDWAGNHYGMWEDQQPYQRGMITATEHLVDIEMLRRAAKGDPAALDSLHAFLDQAAHHDETLGAPARTRIAATKPLGTVIIDRSYGFGGVVHHRLSMTTLSDVRDPESFERAPYRLLKDRVEWFPYAETRIYHGGSQYQKTTYNPLGLLAQLSMCLAVIWLVGHVLRGFGISCLERRSRRLVLVLLLLGTTSILAWQGPLRDGSKRTLDSRPVVATQWMDAAAMRKMLRSPDQRTEVIRMLDNTFSGHEQEQLCLAFDRDLGHATNNRYWTGAISSSLPLVRWQESTYYAGEPITMANRIDPPEYLRRLPSFEHSGLYWWQFRLGGDRSLHMLCFSPAYICMLFVTFYWLWRALAALARRCIARTQRRRLNRDQCIFCAYPLPPEALAARWDDHPRPS